MSDTRHYAVESPGTYPTLGLLVGGAVNSKQILAHWDEILRLATSIDQGTVTAPLMPRKLGGYPRQNGKVVVLRELGRLERTLFLLPHKRPDAGPALPIA